MNKSIQQIDIDEIDNDKSDQESIRNTDSLLNTLKSTKNPDDIFDYNEPMSTIKNDTSAEYSMGQTDIEDVKNLNNETDQSQTDDES